MLCWELLRVPDPSSLVQLMAYAELSHRVRAVPALPCRRDFS